MSTHLGYNLFIGDDATRTMAETRQYLHAVDQLLPKPNGAVLLLTPWSSALPTASTPARCGAVPKLYP
jgi:hypothetical protein